MRQYKIVLVALLGLILTGCYNKFEMPEPQVIYTDESFEKANPELEYISIANLKKIFGATSGTGDTGSFSGTKYIRFVANKSECNSEELSRNWYNTGNYYIKGKVISNDEQGNIYIAKSLPLTELPEERMQMTFGSYGEGDFFSMKGVLETFFESVGMKEKVEYDPNAGKSFLHPGRQASVIYKGVVLGYLGEVHPMVCANYDLKGKVYVAVLDMPNVIPFTTYDRKYEGIAKFPAVTRDISMVVPKNILAGDIEKMLAQRGGKILESYRLFDIYEGEQIEAGFKSMAYALSFRDKTKTLQEDEVAGAMKKIMNGLTSLGIELRK